MSNRRPRPTRQLLEAPEKLSILTFEDDPEMVRCGLPVEGADEETQERQ